MGRRRGKRSSAGTARVDEAYEHLLAVSGLAAEQIRSMALPALEQALERVNDAIAHPDQFPKISFEARSDGGMGVLPVLSASGVMGVLPLLLERKRLIVERIGELRSQERIGGLRELIEQLPDQDGKQNLSERLDALERTASEAEEQAHIAAAERSAAQFEHERQLALLEMHLAERRSKLRSAWWAREALTPMIGTVLLLGLTMALVVAMFAQVEVPALISNSFLIVLGYFFAQSVEARSRRSPGPDGDSGT
jgi:hypothetical protein